MYYLLFTIPLALLAISFYGAHTAFKHLPASAFNAPKEDQHWVKVVLTAPILAAQILFSGFQISILIFKVGQARAINAIKNAQ